jgi:16S rRNA (uracil1498-N3)-methyltransferase
MRIAISSAKQCGRAVVPPITEPKVFSSYTDMTADAVLPAPVIVLVEPGAASGRPFGDLDIPVPSQATLVVGPEGGWSAEEVQAASVLGTLVTLGQRTLRSDAMSLVGLAALFARWREF